MSDSAGEAPTHGVKSSVNSQFSQVAANYRTSTVHAQGQELQEMIAAAKFGGMELVLDAGSGPGHTALAMAPHVRQVIAVDLSTAMLEQGRALATERSTANVEFRQGDVEALPFPDGAFDAVVSRYSAHHWPAPQRALTEIHRVLKPGGQFLLADIVSFEDFTTDTHMQAMELLRDSSHVRDHSTQQWLSIFRAAGFASQVAYQWDLFLDFDAWVTRMATPPLNVQMLKILLAAAPEEVRAALRVQEDYSFTFPGALIHGRRA
jgi:ubiquinone/menaquinone biosynthesis C-methylase UbiE